MWNLLPLALWLLSAACYTPNPVYCDDADGCEGGLVCHLATRTCGAAAADAAPADAGGCQLDDECGSGVCTGDGSCEPAARVVYAAPDGAFAGPCSAAQPCDLVHAAGQAAADRATIRLAAGSYELTTDFEVAPPTTALTIVGARNAVLSRATAGPVFLVRDGARLVVRGVALRKGLACRDFGTLVVERVRFDDAAGEPLPWIAGDACTVEVVRDELDDAPTHAITATAGSTVRISDSVITASAGAGVRVDSGTLEIRRSRIEHGAGVGVDAEGAVGRVVIERSWIAENYAGGACLRGPRFDIVNNFIYRNGTEATPSRCGGLSLSSTAAGNRAAHNTVVRNQCAYDFCTANDRAGGIDCVGGVAPNNLVLGNSSGNSSMPNAQLAGTCAFTNSRTTDSETFSGFVSTVAPYDFHIGNGASPAADAGIATEVMEDFDGQPRGDGMPDVGADEIQ